MHRFLQPVNKKPVDMKTVLVSRCFVCMAACLFSVSVSAQYNFSRLDAKLETYQRSLGNNLVAMIWKDNKLVYQKELGDMQSTTQEPVASCSKWFTAAMIMSFVDEGKISLDDTVGKYLPVFTQNGKGMITIRQCMSHTTGFESHRLNLISLAMTIHKQKKLGSLGAEVDDFAKHTPLIAKPGSEFRYGNIGLNIAGHILEVISGKDFEKIFQERIAEPLLMHQTVFTPGNGIVNPSGSARSTAEDYMHFLVMILQHGIYQGKRILSEKSVEEMQVAQTHASMMKYSPGAAEGFNYALGEWVEEADTQGRSAAVACPGLFGTWPLVDNRHQYAGIVFVKTLLNDQKKKIYLELKSEMDKAITGK